MQSPPPKITAADVQRLYQKLAPTPAMQALIDGAPVLPEATLQAVQQQLADNEQAWLTRQLLTALVLAGEPVYEPADLAAYTARLSMRRYPDGVLIVALDSLPVGEGPGVTRGRVLFGVGEPSVSFPRLTTDSPGTLQVLRPILSAEQALAYEFGRRSGPADELLPFVIDVADDEVHQLQQWARVKYPDLPPIFGGPTGES